VTTPPEPENPTPPPGYVPAPGGYGYVPEDYSWGTEAGQGHQASSSTPPGGTGKPVLAHWVDRVMAGLIDFFGLYFLAVYFNIFGDSKLGFLLVVAATAWGLYNGYQQGQTGQSVGKRVIGLRTVRELDGRPLGGAAGFGRAFLHILDFVPCGLGFLWPLWDSKRQTFADKIMNTMVVKRQ